MPWRRASFTRRPSSAGRAPVARRRPHARCVGPRPPSSGDPLRNIDFSSWQRLLSTVIGLALVTLLGVGVRLLTMVAFQQRRERLNRQINERLRTLIAAYKVLGGSFTGELAVDPTHLRDLRRRPAPDAAAEALAIGERDPGDRPGDGGARTDRARRIRDAVEAALSDIILLGTEEQVRLAATAARELVAGRPVHTRELVVSLRDFIRDALDLDPIPPGVAVPEQGPTRPSPGGGGRGGKGEGGDGGRQGGGSGGGGGGGGGGMGGGMGGGSALGLGGADDDPDDPAHHGGRT